MNKLHVLTYLLGLSLLFTACTKEPVEKTTQPSNIDADNKWVEGDIASDNELWYKVTCEAASTTAYVEWAESSAQGEDKDYTADIMLSAYQLDGVTPYFEDKDNGYGDKVKSFALQNNQKEFLIKVVLGKTLTPGTFAIRARSSFDVEIEYLEIGIGEWKDSVITSVDEYIGFKVKYSGEKQFKVYWAEANAPEDGYTGDVNGSVLYNDAKTFYSVYSNGSGFFQDKKKSFSNDAKVILTDPNEKNFKIQLRGVSTGSFAIKVEEVN